jgi:DNA invertase Pin-like site-specific DNA recombinase
MTKRQHRTRRDRRMGELFRTGMPVVEIARRYRITRHAVYKRLHQLATRNEQRKKELLA